ncbi:hypothetical protein BCR33DRAFT_780997 [Rhizoclosmatium globosum]|nr:hypothetical protein BCR33DRAFT_780997 [Rhizoclosmatium globosum]|eukprot:ORY50219.1 hypothetical protein BCR33DRAFT_780997 [Rhizoclosmatium globosum]
MNSSTTNNTTTNYANEFIAATITDFWITVASSTVLLASFLTIVWKDTSQFTKRYIFTGFNVLYVSMIFSNLLSVLFQYLHYQNTDLTPIVVYNCLCYFFSSIFQFLLVMYTCNRGIPVIKAVVPIVEKYLIIFLVLFGLLLISQYLFLVLSETTVHLVSDEQSLAIITNQNIAIDVLMGSFDFFVACIYFSYLYKNRNTGMNMKRLVILSRFGIASFIVLEFWLTSIVLGAQWSNEPEKQVSLLAFSVNLHISDLGPIMYLFVQLVMKWELYRDDQSGKSENGYVCQTNLKETVKDAETKLN